MSTYAIGRRAGWPAVTTSGIDVGRSLTAAGNGTYVSAAFDGGAAGCRWDRLRFDLALPPGASVTLSTYTADTNRGSAAIGALDASEWAPPVTIAGAAAGRTDTLVRSGPGRYLWVQVTFAASASAVAELRWVDITYPRNTSLRMLPAIYSTQAGGRDFNERLLSMFDAMRDQVKDEIRALGSVIDPRTTDAHTRRDFLDWLGTWFNMELYRAWPVERRRAVIHHAGELFRLRGTVRGIERFIELALGRRVTIVESFVDRHWWFAGRTPLGCSVLLGPPTGERTRFAEILDPFAAGANRMTVYVRCYAEPSADELTMLQSVIDVQKPAHVAASIVLTQPDLRLGVTARLGLDAVTGALAPPAILGGPAPLRLGVNATLGDRP